MKGTVRTIVSLMKFRKDHQLRLEKIFGGAEIVFPDVTDPNSLINSLETADIALFNRPYDPTQFQTPRLKWIHVEQSGINALAKPHIIEMPYAITSASGRSAPVLAEHALFLMLSICYQADKLAQAQHSGEWGFAGDGQRRGLNGKSILIIGMGQTAREIARYCVALGMKTTAYRRKDKACDIPGVATYSAAKNDDLDALLADVDIVALAASLNDTSHRILNRSRLQNMKKGAAVVNVARGQLVDEEAIADFIQQNHLSGYGSDVFSKEPLPADHVFRHLNNVSISPHKTPQMPDRTGRSIDIIEENYRRLLKGEELLNRLMPEDLYTKNNWIPKLLP